MHTRKIATLAALIAVATVSGFAVGQNTQGDTAQFDKDVLTAEGSLILGDYDSAKLGAKRINALTAKAVGDDALTNALIERTLTGYYAGNDAKAGARIQALQALQNQALIEQNRQIIGLLQQIAAKPKTD